MPAPAPIVDGFFDPVTATVSYVASDPATKRAVIIDPVLDYSPRAGRTSTASAERLLAHVAERGLTVDWLLETHVHADHVSAAPFLKQRLGAPVAIGAEVGVVQKTFGEMFNAGPDFFPDGRHFDHLFADGETFAIGDVAARVMATPGHTPACVTYLIGDAAFVGDAMFMPDYGVARCDFPGGDAATLYKSIKKLYELPGETRVFTCHDYQPGGRDVAWETTVSAQRAANIQLNDQVSEADFVAMREARDATLTPPELILPAVQMNMRAGRPPPAEENGVAYLKIPLDLL